MKKEFIGKAYIEHSVEWDYDHQFLSFEKENGEFVEIDSLLEDFEDGAKVKITIEIVES
jgi:hypothetical protein